jgi:ABC-type nitrate/sulfonate/bicarbonate transport system permease component
MNIVKKITRIILFDYWGWKTGIIAILVVIFVGCFIFPNLHLASDVSIPDDADFIYRWTASYTELAHNWVALGFRNLGFVIGGLIACAIGVLIIMGIYLGLRALYNWSHDDTEKSKVDRLKPNINNQSAKEK